MGALTAGIVKILKKFDKNVCKEFAGAASGQAQVEMTPVSGTRVLKDRVLHWVDSMPWRGAGPRLVDLVAGTESLYASVFCAGNLQAARVELLAKQHERPTSWVDLETGLRCGVVCVLIVWALWDCLVDSTIQNISASRQFAAAVPVYRATGCLILLVWCWGLDVYIWNRARVNYLFIFDCDHRDTLGHREVCRHAYVRGGSVACATRCATELGRRRTCGDVRADGDVTDLCLGDGARCGTKPAC